MNIDRHFVRFERLADRLDAAANTFANEGTPRFGPATAWRRMDIRDATVRKVALARRMIKQGREAHADEDYWTTAESITTARWALLEAREALTEGARGPRGKREAA